MSKIMVIGIPDNRVVPFEGAFAVCHLTDIVNARVKPPKCTSANNEHNACYTDCINKPVNKVY